MGPEDEFGLIAAQGYLAEADDLGLLVRRKFGQASSAGHQEE